MSNVVSVWSSEHERFPEVARPAPVTDELNRISNLLRDAIPEDASVSFTFNDKLQVHIDVRNHEDILLIEAALPQRAGRLLDGFTRSPTPQRPFHHRLSAVVNS